MALNGCAAVVYSSSVGGGGIGVSCRGQCSLVLRKRERVEKQASLESKVFWMESPLVTYVTVEPHFSWDDKNNLQAPSSSHLYPQYHQTTFNL